MMRSSDNLVVSFVKQTFSHSLSDENWDTCSSASYSGQWSGRYALERVSAINRSSPFFVGVNHIAAVQAACAAIFKERLSMVSSLKSTVVGGLIRLRRVVHEHTGQIGA